MSRVVEAVDYNKRNYLLRLNDITQRNKWHDKIVGIGGSWVSSDSSPGWLLPRDKIALFDRLVRGPSFRRGGSSRSGGVRSNSRAISRSFSKSDDTEDESDDTDDELIQKALTRRIMSESSRKSIEQEFIDNSDNEDCVSFSRRFRYLYRVIRDMGETIRDLNIKVDDLKQNVNTLEERKYV